ncbi:Uncharacterised protein [Paenibacillus thiaminolyticus]|nr:Uncharacterised protein [Paenibacillus thiaminolyticus]
MAQVDGQGDAYYYLNNQHGDVVQITNRDGPYRQQLRVRRLRPHFVRHRRHLSNSFRYASEQFDPVTQQYYLCAVRNTVDFLHRNIIDVLTYVDLLMCY